MAGGYTYLQSAEGPQLEESSVQVLAGVAGLTIPPEDLADLATILRDQLAAIELLEQFDVSGLQPITTFDPRWHD